MQFVLVQVQASECSEVDHAAELAHGLDQDVSPAQRT